jgi:histidyl-tRNA synthetase
MNVPYVIIFGQREAMDNTVIIRNMQNRSQDTVKIVDLLSYIKKLK